MKHRSLFIAAVALSALISGSAPTAQADDDLPAHRYAESLQQHVDGSVSIDGVTYPDMTSYQRSDVFREEGRRCGSVAQPVSHAMPSDCTFESSSILPEYDPVTDYEIPVVFHAITDNGGNGYVDDAYIQSQLDILNEDFLALAGGPGASGTNSRIRFVLARVGPNGEATSGIMRYNSNQYFNDGFSTKPDLNWDPGQYFNFYINNPGGGILGYATFPWESAGDPDDGVVIGWQFIGRDAPLGGDYNQGRTATHEVGHYLGLLHTFQDGCGSPGAPYTSGDRIGDTQAESGPAFGCPLGQSSCGGGDDPVENYMDYSDDTCMTHFTPEQVNRMRCAITNYRAGLVNAVPFVDIQHSPDGRDITFTSAAMDDDGTIVSWAWDFGDGATSTEENPSHTYSAYGRYQVSLTVADNRGGQATAVTEVLANDLPFAEIMYAADGLSVQFTDNSADMQGALADWSWDFGDGMTSTEQNPSHAFAMDGTYTVRLTVTDGDGAQATAAIDVTVAESGCGCSVGRARSDSNAPFVGGFALLLGVAFIRVRRRRQRS